MQVTNDNRNQTTPAEFEPQSSVQLNEQLDLETFSCKSQIRSNDKYESEIFHKYVPKCGFNHSHSKQVLRLFSINVGGLSTKYDLGIIDLKIKEYDIIYLTETKTQFIENFVFNGFRAISMPAKSNNSKYTGFHGICIYVREELFDDIKVEGDFSVSESIFWFIVDVKSMGLNFLTGVTYIPHEGSKYHNTGIFDNILFDLAKFRSKYNENMPVLMLGDFNARTGTLSDFIDVNELDSDILGLETDSSIKEVFCNLGIPQKRTNADIIVNENGKKLIDLCKVTDLKIMNGRIGENTDNFTCYTGMGKSAIDYLIASKEVIPFISHFKIEPFDRALSDTHCGLTVFLSSERASSLCNDLIKPVDEPCNYLTFDLKWDQNRRDEFLESLIRIVLINLKKQ